MYTNYLAFLHYLKQFKGVTIMSMNDVIAQNISNLLKPLLCIPVKLYSLQYFL